MPPSGLALKPYNLKISWKKWVIFSHYLLPKLTGASSLLARVVWLYKYENLKNAPNFDRLERPPKIDNFQKKFTRRIFLGIGTLLCSGSTTFQKNFFQVFFGPPYCTDIYLL